ncbi:MAG TPA: hypothetical protein VFW07_21620 [Parafilimonas sp.]|nr:hypothetical protein [Parafilimonas sp.]
MKTPDSNTVENSAITSTSFETDGIVSAAASILPPAMQQSFVENGKSAKVVFAIVSARNIVIENAYFKAEYPLIQYITAQDIGVAVNQPSGQMGLIGVGNVDDQGIKLELDVFYNTVDINTSGSVGTLHLTALQYKTDEGMYHAFNPVAPIAAQPMCIVNNIPGIFFNNPDDDTLNNGYKQIAKIVLTGGAGWKLNALPLTLGSPFLREILKSKLIVRYKSDKVAVSDEIQLDQNSRIQTVIKFEGGFKHIAGGKEILKIYADTPEIGKPGNPIITNMYPLSSFVWKDGLGVKIPGDKNLLYFKSKTGQSVYDEK